MPRTSNITILSISIAFGIMALIITMRVMRQDAGKLLGPQSYAVGASQDIGIGTAVSAEDLDFVPAPPNMDRKILFTDTELILGRVTNRDIRKGMAIRSIDLLGEGDSISNLIPAGFQAVTIPIVLPSNTANLLKIGDRVDLLLTYQRYTTDFKSVTLMKNIKVLGVTQESSGGAQVHITVAITAAGAKTLSYAMKKGSLTIAVRPKAEKLEAEEEFYTLEELFKEQDLDSRDVSKEKWPLNEEMEVIRGLNKESYRFIEGRKAQKVD